MNINKQCRNASGPGPYFRGKYERHCSPDGYQWNVKLHHVYFREEELELIHIFALGEHVKLKNEDEYGFENINVLLGREVPSYLSGRSGGWLTIDTGLSDVEIEKVDNFVQDCLKAIPQFLKDEREYQAEEEQKQAEEERRALCAEGQARVELQGNADLMQALATIDQLAGSDCVVIVKGIKLR